MIASFLTRSILQIVGMILHCVVRLSISIENPVLGLAYILMTQVLLVSILLRAMQPISWLRVPLLTDILMLCPLIFCRVNLLACLLL